MRYYRSQKLISCYTSSSLNTSD